MSAINELSVITKSKDLCSYILTITEKSPKRFRFTIVTKLQNYALELIEHLFRANEIYIGSIGQQGRDRQIEKRLMYQHSAMTELKLLGYMAQVAMGQQCILPKQYEQITKKIYDTQNLLGAWIKSDRKRFGV